MIGVDMKLLACAVFLVCCVVFASQPPSNHAFANRQLRNVTNTGDESEAEKQKRITVCEDSGEEKPLGEIRKVSQLCGKALSLPKPTYPKEAKGRASGTVVVDVVTNEEGRVIWAKASSGPELLRAVSEKAACRAQYSPTLVAGRAIRTENKIQYHFVSP